MRTGRRNRTINILTFTYSYRGYIIVDIDFICQHNLDLNKVFDISPSKRTRFNTVNAIQADISANSDLPQRQESQQIAIPVAKSCDASHYDLRDRRTFQENIIEPHNSSWSSPVVLV